jgi:hypothetical protein
VDGINSIKSPSSIEKRVREGRTNKYQNLPRTGEEREDLRIELREFANLRVL